MKKYFLTIFFVITFFLFGTVSASAVVNDTVKVGIRFGSEALFSANLENNVGRGYSFGYFDDDREFVPIGETQEIAISMTAAGTVYMDRSGNYSPNQGDTMMGDWRVQIEGFDTFEEAESFALEVGGWPAWINQMYVVRIGCYDSQAAAETALEQYMPESPAEELPPPAEELPPPTEELPPPTEELPPPAEELPLEEIPSDEAFLETEGSMEGTDQAILEETFVVMSQNEGGVTLRAVQCSSTGIIVTKTRTGQILFEYDCWGIFPLGVMPNGQGEKAVTWFKGYRYHGGFEYVRVTGGNLNVCNVVNLEDYVKGVIPYEMNPDWPAEALKAQSVCARTYVCSASKHQRAYGFDVCNTTDCQVYYGVGKATAASDAAVHATAGECLYHDGVLLTDAVYHSSDGGATEDAKNVWGGNVPYLLGKEDPYEALISIPNYRWSVTYTAQELTWILEQKGYSIGTVKNVYISEFTPTGNVKEVTFEGSKKTQRVTGNTCSTIFYSSTYNKSVKSMRFGINGSGLFDDIGEAQSIYVNDTAEQLSDLKGISVISGSGSITTITEGAVSVLTASGLMQLGEDTTNQNASEPSNGTFLIEGVGSGHNVGMSQYGARAMAENGYGYDEILAFYYTGVSIE